MRSKKLIALASLALMPGAMGIALAAESGKPAVPSITDILNTSGISESGYIDASYAYFTYQGTGAPKDYNTFLFQQAGLTISKTPSAGFGGLLDAVISSYSPYAYNYAPTPGGTPSPRVYLLQGYASYTSGPWTVIGGKFGTIAGAELYAPTGNTNVTRSLLFDFEPVTITGLRASYTVNSMLGVTLGLDNGWFNAGDQGSFGSGKTVEAGVDVTPNKAFSWVLAGYFGRELNLSGKNAELNFLDTVLTWNATPALTLVGSVDWGDQSEAFGPGTASGRWIGGAGYVNYAFNSQWRVSLRGEYLEDSDGYLTGVAGPLKEVTVTFGYDPVSSLELRLEGRYDDTAVAGPTTTVPAGYAYVGAGGYAGTAVKGLETWFEALYKF